MSNSDRSYRKLIKKETVKAAQIMRSNGWPDAYVTLVRTMRYPMRSRTQTVWVKQICGEPFDLKHDVLDEECDLVDYPVWLASDGQLYEIALAGDRTDDWGSSPLGKVSMYDWPVRDLKGLYVLVLRGLLKITEPASS